MPYRVQFIGGIARIANRVWEFPDMPGTQELLNLWTADLQLGPSAGGDEDWVIARAAIKRLGEGKILDPPAPAPRTKPNLIY